MRRKRKSDTEKALELVIGTLIAIPVASIATTKWLFSSWNQSKLKAASIRLEDIDNMDGLSFEYYVAELLKKNGYSQVNLTPASGDFGVDILAVKDNRKWAFQCKNYRSNLGIGPIQEVFSGAVKYKAQTSVVITNSYFTKNAQEFANSLGVLLWDRTVLAKLINSAYKQ